MCRTAPILRLLTQDRAAAQSTSASSHSQNGGGSEQTRIAGEGVSRSTDVSRLLDGLRERLSAFEQAQADAVEHYHNADPSGNGRQSAADEAGPSAPRSEQQLWAQRAPLLVHSAAAGLEEDEPADENVGEEQEIYDPSQFDASVLGDSAEARRLLSILCAPVRGPAPAPMDDTDEAEPASERQPPSWGSFAAKPHQGTEFN